MEENKGTTYSVLNQEQPGLEDTIKIKGETERSLTNILNTTREFKESLNAYEEYNLLVKAGVKPELGRAYEAFKNPLERHARKYVKDPHKAEDLVEDTFLRVHKHYDSLDVTRGWKSVQSWFYTIITNLCRNAERNKGRRPVYLLTDVVPEDYTGSARDEFDFILTTETASRMEWERIDHEQLQEKVKEAVEELPKHQKITFQLREEGNTYEEIGEKTNTKVGTVKSRLNRARRGLRRRLRETPVIIDVWEEITGKAPAKQ